MKENKRMLILIIILALIAGIMVAVAAYVVRGSEETQADMADAVTSVAAVLTIQHTDSAKELNNRLVFVSMLDMQTIELSAVVTTPDGEKLSQSAIWSSSDPKIAAVNEEGVITLLEAGTVEIKAEYTNNGDVYAAFNLTVGEIGTSDRLLYPEQEDQRIVADILSKIGDHNMNFLLASDLHNMGEGEHAPVIVAQIQASNKHAGENMSLIAEQIDLDFLAILGDIAYGSDATTPEEGAQSIELAVGYLSDAMSKTEHSVLLSGNHDYLYNASVFSGYHYRDYNDKKIRVIFLNTVDGKSEYISPEQLQWLAGSLDLSEKEDASEWGIILLSHHPLDWGNIIPAANLLQAYLSGANYSARHDGKKIAYDFTGKNMATVIAQFHGNSHCLKVDSIHYLSDGEAVPTAVQRIAIPNACFERSNEYGQNSGPEYYGIEFGEDVTYNKVSYTSHDTSFCVVSIDLDMQRIYVDCYGAGYDRIVDYTLQSDIVQMQNKE